MSKVSRLLDARLSSAVLASLLWLAPFASAWAQVGSGPWASPGLSRVLVARETEPGVDAALVGGYGYTEDVLGAGDSHHRLLGSAAVAGRPLSFLTIAARFDGRWDQHLASGTQDQSAVGDPRIALRGDFALDDTLALGLAALVLVPGTDAPSLAFEATTLDLRALGAWTPHGTPLTLALDLGWRFDGTARAVERPVPFSRADMVSLGASDSDALLIGLGAVVRVDDSELFAELSSDVLVESDTSASPVRLGAGARLSLVPRLLSLFAAAEVGLGGRPVIDASATLAPVEPRFALSIGLVLAPRSGPAVEGTDGGEGEGEGEQGGGGGGSGGASGTRRGRILDPSGTPVAGAIVHVVGAPEPRTTTSADGTFVLEGVPEDAALEVEAEGYVAMRIEPGSEAATSAVLERALPRGALRGLIRSHGTRTFVATVRVEPGGATATTDADGLFEIALPPGRYDVTIEAPGYERQRRSVEIEVDGVTVLNAELRRSR